MPIHSVAEHNDLPYLVMPYVRGESLQKRISNSGPLAPIEVVRIGMQIASGLAAAHAHGLVHRDIKPANVILEDGVDKLWITDFGLARLVDDASLTRTGVIAGTPEYMSPEQARGEVVDERSDLFSLGTVMFSMCTGHPPFRAASSYGVLRRIIDDDPRPIREVNEQAPVWLEQFIAKLLAKKPANRFATANETAELLKESLAHMQHPTALKLPKPVQDLVPNSFVNWMPTVWVTVSVLLLFVGWLVLKESGFNGWSLNPPISQPKQQARSLAGNQANLGKQVSLDNERAVAHSPVNVSEIRSEHVLPANTHAWVSIPDINMFQANFDKTQIGILLNDDSMKPFFEPTRYRFR